MKILIPLFVVALVGFCGIPSSHAQEQVELETTSEQGTFLIRISWMQNEIGKDHTFKISFIEPETGSELEDIQYNFIILNGETNQQVVRRVDQIATEQKALFDEVGPYTIAIEDIEGLDEGATLPIQVTPEFSVGVIIPVMSVTLAAILVVRYGAKSLFSQ